jgi:hypothetical protein
MKLCEKFTTESLSTPNNNNNNNHVTCDFYEFMFWQNFAFIEIDHPEDIKL